MILVIAEKPSVAQSIGKVLGATSRKDGYMEGNNYIADMKSVTLNDMDGEIAELMYKTVRKLEAMTDAEFDELYIMPDSMMDD